MRVKVRRRRGDGEEGEGMEWKMKPKTICVDLHRGMMMEGETSGVG